MRKFLLGKTPFLRRSDESNPSVRRMMIDVVIALCPLIIFGWVKNGLLPFINESTSSVITMLYPLLFVLAGALTSFVLEALYHFLFLKVRDFKDLMYHVTNSFAVIPGIMLALILPVQTPIVYLIFGCFLANIVFKMLFGGFGHNIFNPALIAFVILAVTFKIPSYLNLSETLNADIITLTSSSTPLAVNTLDYAHMVAPYGGLLNFFFGFVPGGLGMTSVVLMIVGYIYLVIRKVINWKTPVIYLGSALVVVLITKFLTGLDWWWVGYQMLTGSMWFGAIFMATEPVTTPKNEFGKIIFAIGCGVLTMLFRLCGMFPEGVATAILFMGLFTPAIDRMGAIVTANKFKGKALIAPIVVCVLLVGIAIYTALTFKKGL